jgi:16S rRNA (guanine527-N7)-methyltransferase
MIEQQLQEQLNRALQATTLAPTDEQVTALVRLVLLVNKWNKAYNLTSVRDPQDMLIKHILDSIVVAPHISGSRVIDVGTGPGFPGLPLAIMLPDVEFVLLDSLGKRIRFIKQAVFELGLRNVTAVQSRVEDYQPEQAFDNVLSRAFASLHDMLTWCTHLVSADGQFLALKGQIDEQELKQIPNNFIINTRIALTVPQLEGERHLIHIQKQ